MPAFPSNLVCVFHSACDGVLSRLRFRLVRGWVHTLSFVQCTPPVCIHTEEQ